VKDVKHMAALFAFVVGR